MHSKQQRNIVIAGILICLISGIATAQVEEYTLKAVFMEKISRFLKWPGEETPDGIGDRFIITVFGKNPFGTSLDTIYADRKIKNKPVEIRYAGKVEEIQTPHILYVASSERQRLPALMNKIKAEPIVTICDSEGYIAQGVLVNMKLVGSKLNIEINEKGFNAADIKINSLLLKVAKNVNPI